MKFLFSALYFGLAIGSAQAGQHQTAERVSIFSAKPQGELIKVCKGCGCRGGGGYRLPNGKCAPR